MSYIWGGLMMIAGLLMMAGGTLKSDLIIYRLMVARSKMLWGDNVHRFHQVVGVIIVIFGSFVAVGYM